MDFIHGREYLDSGQSVRVDCDYQCNVMLLDDHNYSNYRSGRGFDYFGGHYTHLPTTITPPRTGYWNVVIDLGGGSANIRYSISIVG